VWIEKTLGTQTRGLLSVQCLYRDPDLIVEVAHPSITVEYGELFLDVADYMVCG